MAVLSLVAALIAGAGAVGIAYQLAAARLVVRFQRAPRVAPTRRPPLSVLKPLCGMDEGLGANLRSLVDQDYPEFQVVCGVANAADPALAVAREVAASGRGAVEVVVDSRVHGANLKVSNLINMAPSARHPVIVIADSDVRVPAGHLDDVVAPLADPSVGLVTCLYVARPASNLASRLGAMGINHGFLPSALVARALGRKDGCFGATMALGRETLEAAGGLARLADILADDWALGAAVRRQGRTIAVAARPVDLMMAEADLKTLLAHEIRWGRTIAAIDRPSYIASVITQPLVLALIAAALGGVPYLGLAALAWAVRLYAVRVEERALGLARAPVSLLFLREALSFVVFVAATVGRSVWWRGMRFRVRRDGTMELLEGYPT